MKSPLPILDQEIAQSWNACADRYSLSEYQLAQLQRYSELLCEWNKVMDLTAVESMPAIISHHFEDSLALTKEITIKQGDGLCDVGSGAGFPGIPLKIYYPELKVVLIEVLAKRVEFLQAVIDELGLKDIEISTLDWRTFLRSTTHPITYVCARASLRPDELVRMFKPSSPYKNGTLIYWASDKWTCAKQEQPFLIREASYAIDGKQRKLVFFGATQVK